VIHVDKDAVKLVPKSVAEKRFVVPHHVADRQLFLLMRDPHDATAVDEAQFASGMKVTPVVVTEARMWALLQRHYGVSASLRPIPLDGPVRPRGKKGDTHEMTSLGPELTSEEEFQRLYAGMHAATGPAPVDLGAAESTLDDVSGYFGAGPANQSGTFLAPPKTGGVEEHHEGWRDEIEHTNPMMMRPKNADFSSEPFPLIDALDPAEQTFTWPERQQTLDFHIDVAQVVDETPLSFADASRVLQAAADRDAIARTVLRAARTKFKRACILTVYPDRFVGWLGIGEGMAAEHMKDVVIPRSDRSVFGLVAQSRSHYLGPLQRWPLHGQWVKVTGRKLPQSLAVFPILVKGRVVNLLVVDNGHGEHVGSDVGEVVILAQQIAKTYESLLRA
jgi:hypothetical protein